MTTRHAIFSSKNISEIYSIYEEISDQFLKHFKFHAEFVISSYTSNKIQFFSFWAKILHRLNGWKLRF